MLMLMPLAYRFDALHYYDAAMPLMRCAAPPCRHACYATIRGGVKAVINGGALRVDGRLR